MGGTKENRYVTAGSLKVAQVLYDFINQEALPGTGVDEQQFWSGFGEARSRPCSEK